ncbi:Disease resistance protein [Corchorus olitorius]|uniref:Disease resistance protein n=1 Tax=Corchorus olitorius TaxID=93759 RepID=A0A1R3KH54_9ROSI|nr:Disease resistance protein [Corchorus olitorius]
MESSIADLLLGKIVSILENEVALFSGLRDEVKEIKLELISMRSFLEDVDKTRVHSKTESAWISSVRDMVFEVEDIIDEFTYHVIKQRQLGFFPKVIRYPGNLLLRRKVAVKLRDINQRIKGIAERNQRYGGANRLEGADKNLGGTSSNYDPNWLRNHSEASLFFKDDDLVGIDKAQKKLLGWLLDEEPRRSVVSVVGMGGLGKTTLVANTFKKQIVKQHFDCSAWITVSQQYGIHEILRSMVREVCEKANEQTPENLSSMSYRDLVETLVEILQPKRYLIVLDDVWHINFWHDINIALPINITGSRILLTTRMEDIASFEFDVVNFVFPLNPLTGEASWNLFCKKAFANKQAQCPPYLDPLARNLVAKCEGLSLAIVALGDGIEVEESGIRRLSIETKEEEIKACQGIRRLRSLFTFADVDIPQSSFNMLASGLKLLRVLDLEDAPILELPRQLVYLFNLRYLNLTRTKVKELPKSIGKLSNLQSLIAKGTQIKELPPGIVKLKNLRHLVAYGSNGNIMEFEIGLGIRVPSNICSLEGLQVLSTVEARGNLIKQLSRMTQLTSLHITKLKEADYENLCNSIGNMRFLRTLTVMSHNEDEALKMDALEAAPPLLEKLALLGELQKIPHWFNSLHSLTNLILHWSRLREDFLPHIQALPNLGELFLINAYDGERLCFLEGFQKLKRLFIGNCPRLEEVVMNKGVMPGLEVLYVISCPEFTTLPHGWESDLADLKQVFLHNVSSKIMQQLCAAADVDYQPTIQAAGASKVEIEDYKFEWRYKFSPPFCF